MAPKGTFSALPVRAQAYIIQLYEDTCEGFCQKPRYWHTANQLNYHHGMRTVSSLSAESYWFSLRRRNPTIDELMEKVFSAGEPLTILQVRQFNDGVSTEVFSETIKYFLAAQHPLSMRVFTVACFCRLLEWPEALSGLVRPCPKCSDYRLSKESGQERHFDSRPTAYEAFHFHNKVTGQWLSVGAHMAIPINDGGSKNPYEISGSHGMPAPLRRLALAAIVLDVFGYLTRSELETGMLVCGRWQALAEHVKSLPLRHIMKAVYFNYGSVPKLDVRSKSAVLDGMDPVIRAIVLDNDNVSADASSLLRNAYVERLETRGQAPEPSILGDLVIGEFVSYDDHVRCNAVNTVGRLVPMTHLQKVTLDITLASFAQNSSKIFDAATRTSVKCLYMDIFREFGDNKQLDDTQLQPSTFLAIREQWLDFVFNSLCDHAIVLVRHSLPEGLPCPFSPNEIISRFLDMDSIGHLTTCVIEGAPGRPTKACVVPVAKRQTFPNNGFLRRLNRSVGAELYDVYYVRNERAGATLSVLVGATSYRNRVILMKGAFECGDEVRYPSRQYGEVSYNDYEQDDDGDGEEDDEAEEEHDAGTDEEGEKEDKDNDETE